MRCKTAQFRAIIQRASRCHRLQREAHLNVRRAEVIADKPAALVQVLFEEFAVRRDLLVEIFALHALPIAPATGRSSQGSAAGRAG